MDPISFAWQVVTFAGTLGGAWAVMRYRMAQAEARIRDLEACRDTTTDDVSDLKTRVAVVEDRGKSIEKGIDELKGMISNLNQNLINFMARGAKE